MEGAGNFIMDSGKRLIFTVSSGRSGTGYLSKNLSVLVGFKIYHEPEPRFDRVMRAAQSDPNIARRFWIEQKLPFIESLGKQIYAEASHLFCKGFVEPLLELGIVPDIVILSRPRLEVARSLYELGHIPGKTAAGLQYLLSPDDPNVLPLDGWHKLDDYQLCVWYCIEIERRQRHYKRLFEGLGARVVCVTFSQLLSGQGFDKITREMGLPVPRWTRKIAYYALRHRKINAKSSSKARTLNNAKIGEMEQELLRLLQGDWHEDK